MKLDKLAEQQIKQAQRRGELDKLKGAGEPFRTGQTTDTGVDGFGYQAMADARVLPDEIRLKKAITELNRELQSITDPYERKLMLTRLANMQAKLGIAEEAHKRYGL